jgi:hypothetical protein
MAAIDVAGEAEAEDRVRAHRDAFLAGAEYVFRLLGVKEPVAGEVHREARLRYPIVRTSIRAVRLSGGRTVTIDTVSGSLLHVEGTNADGRTGFYLKPEDLDLMRDVLANPTETRTL